MDAAAEYMHVSDLAVAVLAGVVPETPPVTSRLDFARHVLKLDRNKKGEQAVRAVCERKDDGVQYFQALYPHMSALPHRWGHIAPEVNNVKICKWLIRHTNIHVCPTCAVAHNSADCLKFMNKTTYHVHMNDAAKHHSLECLKVLREHFHLRITPEVVRILQREMHVSPQAMACYQYGQRHLEEDMRSTAFDLITNGC